MQKRTFIKSLAAVTALSAIVLLTGCDEEKAVAEKPFRVGVTLVRTPPSSPKPQRSRRRTASRSRWSSSPTT